MTGDQSQAAPRTPLESPSGRAHDARADAIRKSVSPSKSGKPRVQLQDVGKTAAEHDHIGVQDVDDDRKAMRKAILINRKALLRMLVATGTRKNHFLRRQMFTGAALIVARKTGTRQERLDTA